MPMNPSIGEIRQLRRVACDNCRTRKLRCGRALGGPTPAHEPCSNCVERNLICTEFDHKRSRVGRRKRRLPAPAPASYGEIPPGIYAPTATGYAHPGYGCDDHRPLSYPQGAWTMPPTKRVPLEPHLAQAMQPWFPLPQHPPSHARPCADGSVLHPSLYGLPGMPSQSRTIPPQAPVMLPQGGAVLHQPVLPSQSGVIPPQLQAMLPQPPVMPLHLGLPRQSAAPMHLVPPLRPPRSPPSYYPAHVAPTVLMPPQASGAYPPYEYAR